MLGQNGGFVAGKEADSETNVSGESQYRNHIGKS